MFADMFSAIWEKSLPHWAELRMNMRMAEGDDPEGEAAFP